jgi:hypothetical protein
VPEGSGDPHGLIVLNLEGDRIYAITRFVDSSVLSGSGSRERCLTSAIRPRGSAGS